MSTRPTDRNTWPVCNQQRTKAGGYRRLHQEPASSTTVDWARHEHTRRWMIVNRFNIVTPAQTFANWKCDSQMETWMVFSAMSQMHDNGSVCPRSLIDGTFVSHQCRLQSIFISPRLIAAANETSVDPFNSLTKHVHLPRDEPCLIIYCGQFGVLGRKSGVWFNGVC